MRQKKCRNHALITFCSPCFTNQYFMNNIVFFFMQLYFTKLKPFMYCAKLNTTNIKDIARFLF